MSRMAAFLRAINVGGRTVKMDALKEVFAQMGFMDVVTYIASGNVIFTAEDQPQADLEAQIEAALTNAFGFDIPTFVRTESQLQELAEAQPFSAAELDGDTVTYVSFLRSAPGEDALQRLIALEDGVITFKVADAHVHWLRHKERGDSKITNGGVEKALGVAATRRNMNTIHKMLKKF